MVKGEFNDYIIKWNIYKFEESSLSKNPNYYFLLKAYYQMIGSRQSTGVSITSMRQVMRHFDMLFRCIYWQEFNTLELEKNKGRIQNEVRQILKLLYGNLSFIFETSFEKPQIPYIAKNKDFIAFDVEDLDRRGIGHE